MCSERIKRGGLVSVIVIVTISAATAQDNCKRDCKGCNGSETCDQCLKKCREGKGTGTNLNDAFQIGFASDFDIGDSFVEITNSGVSTGTSDSPKGLICANVYAFSPDEQMISCCSCPVTPNGLVSLSARGDLINNTLTRVAPTSIAIELLASAPVGESCISTAVSPSLTSGMIAWRTGLHAAPHTDLNETAFLQAGLSTGELNNLTSRCDFIQSNGSGFGICNSCRTGGLIASKP